MSFFKMRAIHKLSQMQLWCAALAVWQCDAFPVSQ